VRREEDEWVRSGALDAGGSFRIAARLLLVAALATGAVQIAIVATTSITAFVFLAALGAVGAKAGGAPVVAAASRVTSWVPRRWRSPR